MKKGIVLIMLCFLITLNISYAWNWQTHQMFVEKTYNSMPLDLREKLNLTAMKEGAIAPDKDFHDNVKHHYPPSYELALKWLNFSCDVDCDYNQVSYDFGVASHYISDSFVAPHYISKEPSYLHSEFERQNYISKVKCYDYNLNLEDGLKIGSENYKDWGEWLVSKDKNIIYNEIDEAMTAIYSVAFDKFNFECATKETKVEYITGYVTKENTLLGSGFLFVIIILLFLFKKKVIFASK